MALDKVPIQMMTPMDSASETAPANPNVGQRWYRASTAVTYQYTNDGTSSFWLDITGGNMNLNPVDFVGTVDPHSTTNGAGLAVGSIYYNKNNGKTFVCHSATTDNNVWKGTYAAEGGTVTSVTDSGVVYRMHTFTSSGTFRMEYDITCNILVVGGGGGSGYWGGCGGGGGSVYQRTNFSLTKGDHTVVVGAGGLGAPTSGSGSGAVAAGANGANSKLGSAHIGFGGGGGASASHAALDGGCGGGQDSDVGTAGQQAGKGIDNISAGTSVNGDTLTADHKTYSFATTPLIVASSGVNGGGGGGAGSINGVWDNSNDTFSTYPTGHGGMGGHGKLISWATHAGTSIANDTSGTRGYYAGGGHGVTHASETNVPGGSKKPVHANTGAGGCESASADADGASGIVIVRYAL